MKAFVNLLILDPESSTVEEIEEQVLQACEENGLKVVWHRSKEADDE